MSDFLYERDDHGIFHGGMEQRDREEALIMFRNGTVDILVATDLAARGIDIPEMNFIIHYQLPHSLGILPTEMDEPLASMQKERRMCFILKRKNQKNLFPIFQQQKFLPRSLAEVQEIKRSKPYWETLFITGGRKDKISKGDVAGIL